MVGSELHSTLPIQFLPRNPFLSLLYKWVREYEVQELQKELMTHSGSYIAFPAIAFVIYFKSVTTVCLKKPTKFTK